ncbi:aminoglycoside phosphotransferase family protein [Nocardia speluncae]|uniref:Aminoglycoside phosphotransferase family protein n=1 Tax=Nocardia speluncae TaxID=419477 RepID=A0A846XCR6_9NOCA|nr:aminoglycoside phosphotransferase family protein [Nocardia speluncae]NKY33858.1 aminoglycoside phosphotransferase family protein [Nocardia speluncae]
MTSTHDILSAACRLAGIPADDAELLHAHSNSVYHLPSANVVARINGNDHAGLRAKASLTITRWLADHDLPVTEPALDHAIDIAGSTVTFWTYYPQHRTDRPSPQHLGEILAHLHTLPAPPFPLPDYQPLIGLVSILTTDITPTVLSAADRRWLCEQAEQLIAEYRTQPTLLGRGMVHGDAYTGNTLWAGGTVLLGDWDETSIAPRELDLANTVQARRFGLPEADIDAFLRAYGRDPRGEPLFDALVSMRDLHTLTSYIRRAQRGDIRAQAELTTRLQSLQDPTMPERWVSV